MIRYNNYYNNYYQNKTGCHIHYINITNSLQIYE